MYIIIRRLREMMQVLYNREIFNNYKNCKTIPELFPLVECEVTLSSFLTRYFLSAVYYIVIIIMIF